MRFCATAPPHPWCPRQTLSPDPTLNPVACGHRTPGQPEVAGCACPAGPCSRGSSDVRGRTASLQGSTCACAERPAGPPKVPASAHRALAGHDMGPHAPVHQLGCGSWSVCLQTVMRPFQLTESYTAPKGALLMPSIIAANMQARCCTSAYMPHSLPSPLRQAAARCASSLSTGQQGQLAWQHTRHAPRPRTPGCRVGRRSSSVTSTVQLGASIRVQGVVTWQGPPLPCWLLLSLLLLAAGLD